MRTQHAAPAFIEKSEVRDRRQVRLAGGKLRRRLWPGPIQHLFESLTRVVAVSVSDTAIWTLEPVLLCLRRRDANAARYADQSVVLSIVHEVQRKQSGSVEQSTTRLSWSLMLHESKRATLCCMTIQRAGAGAREARRVDASIPGTREDLGRLKE